MRGPLPPPPATHPLGACLFAVLLSAPPILAQSRQPPRQDPASGPEWPVDPATHPRPTAAVVRASGPIVVDGHPDEAAWREAVPITRFVQAQPDVGHPASERSEVRLLYDDEAIYISCACHDSRPDELTVTSLARDFPVGRNDALSFVFNPNPERRTGFMFSVNPDGAWWDGQTFDDMRVVNSVWDSPMEAAAQRTEYGWSMEAAIPWTTLRFEGSPGSQEWGFNVLRRTRRVNELAYWSPLQRHENLGKLSRAGTLTGLASLRQGRNLRIKPYVLGAAGAGGSPGTADDELDAGADLKYGLTSRLTLDVSYRTDFSHVEADEVQLNLTRFPLFFPERREFFIENSGMFEFGDRTRREYRIGVSPQDFTLFHTRRVGLTVNGRPIPILGGSRLSGSVGDLDIGTLAMRTRPTTDRPAENFAMVRLRRRILGDSNVGVIFTHRNLTGEDGATGHNRVYGLDASVNVAERLLLTSYAAAIDDPGLTGSALDRGALRVSAGWRDRLWNTTVLYRRFGDAFDPGLGFVRRKAMNHYYATVGIHPTVRQYGLQEINPYAELDHYTDLESVTETRRVAGGLDLAFADGSGSSLVYESLFERLFEPFRVSGSQLTIEPGAYGANRITVTHQTSPARLLSLNASLSHGGYFGGIRTTYGVGGVWRPSPHFSVDVDVERNEIEVPDGDLVADVGRVLLSVDPGTRFFTSAFVQYNGLTDEVLTNARLRFIHAPVSDLYLVYSERRDVRGSGKTARSVALKVTRLFAF